MAALKTAALFGPTAVTASGTGTAQTLEPGSNRWVGVLSLGAVTGTTPTLDVTIQHSSDGTNWVTLRAFSQLTAANASSTIHLFAAAATDYLIPLLPYVRISYTVGGGTPSFGNLSVRLYLDS